MPIRIGEVVDASLVAHPLANYRSIACAAPARLAARVSVSPFDRRSLDRLGYACRPVGALPPALRPRRRDPGGEGVRALPQQRREGVAARRDRRLRPHARARERFGGGNRGRPPRPRPRRYRRPDAPDARAPPAGRRPTVAVRSFVEAVVADPCRISSAPTPSVGRDLDRGPIATSRVIARNAARNTGARAPWTRPRRDGGWAAAPTAGFCTPSARKCGASARDRPIGSKAVCDDEGMSIRTRLRLPPDPSRLPDRLTRDGWWLVAPRRCAGRIDTRPTDADPARASPGPTSRADAPSPASETVP